MTMFWDLREAVKEFYIKNERILLPVLKFLLSLMTFAFINSTAGVLQKWNPLWCTLILSLISVVLPYSAIAVLGGFMIVWGFYQISMELAIASALVLLLMYFLFFYFSPKSSLIVLLVPLAFLLKIPEIVPVLIGLLGSISCIVPMVCGGIVYYILMFAKLNGAAIVSMENESSVNRLSYFFNQVFMNKEMYLWLAMLVLVTVVVYFIRKRNINHSWTFAVISGTVMELLIILAGEYIMNTDNDILFLVLGSVLAIVIGIGTEIFFLNLDYSRIEYVQFEDDEYYYYVKAVPKLYVSAEDKVVKKFNTRNSKKKTPGEETAEIERMLDEFYGE